MSRLNILSAYPYTTASMQRAIGGGKDCIRYLLDSGAFTAWRQGKAITVSEYCDFLDSMDVPPWRYFNLDVIGDGAASRKNYDEMLRRGYSPIPIFTRGENIAALDAYYESSDVVGIGGLVQTRGNVGFVKGIMRHVGDRRVHWLGFTKQNFVTHFKPYMCDSTGWAGGVKYGRVKMYTGNGRWLTFDKGSFTSKPSLEIQEAFGSYGLDWRKFTQKSEWVNSGKGKNLIELVSARSFVKYSLDVEKKFRTKMFLACASDWQVKIMLDAYRFWVSRSVKERSVA